MAILKDLTTSAAFTSEGSYKLQTVPGAKGPRGFPVLQCRLFDGATGSGSAAANERQEVQWGRVPYGADQWIVLDLRFMLLPAWVTDRWMDWIQTHDTDASPQAPMQGDLGPGTADGHRMRMNLTKGTARHSYTDLGPAEVGVWRRIIIGHRPSTGADGFVKITVDGQVRMDYRGPTIDSRTDQFGKAGGYRNAVIDGQSIHEYSGMQVFSTEAEALAAAGAVSGPPAADTMGPVVTVTSPQRLERFVDGRVTWAATVLDPSGVAEVSFAVDGQILARETKAPYGDGSPTTLPASLLPGEHVATIRAVDAVGNMSEVSLPILIGSPAPPPPPSQTSPLVAIGVQATRVAAELDVLSQMITSAQAPA